MKMVATAIKMAQIIVNSSEAGACRSGKKKSAAPRWGFIFRGGEDIIKTLEDVTRAAAAGAGTIALDRTLKYHYGAQNI